MKKTLALFVIVMTALIGCSKASDPMVGTWKLQVDEAIASKMPAGEKIEVTVEFKADKTFAVHSTMGSRHDDIEGTYTLEGKTLTMTTTKEDGKPSSDKPETVTLSEDMKSFEMPGGDGKIVKQ